MVQRIYRRRKELELQGKSEREIRTLLTEERKILMKDFNCSIGRVSATTAWQKIRLDNAAQDKYTSTHVKFAKRYVALASGAADREQHVLELVDMLHLPREVIEDMTSGVRTQTERVFELLDSRKAASLARVLQDEFETSPKEKTKGEHVDYETPSKRKHRDCVLELNTAFASTDRLGRLKHLSLPNKRCGEIHGLTDIGYSRENLWAVEGGDRVARSEFMHYARILQLQNAYAGQLEDLLPGWTTRFDSVHLDFLGPASPVNIQIMRKLLLTERSLVITNTMAKREHTIKEKLRSLWYRIVAAVKQRRSLTAAADSKPGTAGTPPADEFEYSLEEARELSPLLLSTGLDRKENWALGGSFEQLPTLQEFQNVRNERDRIEASLTAVLVPMFEEIEDMLREGPCFDKSLDDQIALGNLRSMFFDALFGNAHLSDLKKFSYQSDVGATRSPFFIDAAVVHTPLALYQKIAPAVMFLLNCASHCLELIDTKQGNTNVIDRLSFQIMRRGQSGVHPHEAQKKDSLVLMQDDRQQICRIELYRLAGALKDYHDEITRKIDMVKLFEMRSAERISLTQS